LGRGGEAPRKHSPLIRPAATFSHEGRRRGTSNPHAASNRPPPHADRVPHDEVAASGSCLTIDEHKVAVGELDLAALAQLKNVGLKKG
jgi:hypothetical protein